MFLSFSVVVEKMGNYLKWRKEKGVDEMRKNIVEGGMDHPLKFPQGEKILALVPQLVLAAPGTGIEGAMDKMGAPICVDQCKDRNYVHVPSSCYIKTLTFICSYACYLF